MKPVSHQEFSGDRECLFSAPKLLRVVGQALKAHFHFATDFLSSHLTSQLSSQDSSN